MPQRTSCTQLSKTSLFNHGGSSDLTRRMGQQSSAESFRQDNLEHLDPQK